MNKLEYLAGFGGSEIPEIRVNKGYKAQIQGVSNSIGNEGEIPEIPRCPYRIECVSKVTKNCIPNYQDCMAYKFYEMKKEGKL
jgi:hypothetical protein